MFINEIVDLFGSFFMAIGLLLGISFCLCILLAYTTIRDYISYRKRHSPSDPTDEE